MGLMVVEHVSRTGKFTGASVPMTEDAVRQYLAMLQTDEGHGDRMRLRLPTPEELATAKNTA